MSTTRKPGDLIPIYQTGWPRPENVWGDVDQATYEAHAHFGYTRRRIVYAASAPGRELPHESSQSLMQQGNTAGANLGAPTITKDWCIKMAALDPEEGVPPAGLPAQPDERAADAAAPSETCAHDYVRSDNVCTECGGSAAITCQSVHCPQAAPHSDDEAVDRFATAMKEKLAAARKKGRGGWEHCDPSTLSAMLREHVEKGDPLDVANFCMMLWHLGAPVNAAASQAGRPLDPNAVAVAKFTASGEYTPTPGAHRVAVVLIGEGAAGGGSSAGNRAPIDVHQSTVTREAAGVTIFGAPDDVAAAAAALEAKPRPAYPDELTPDLREVLGWMCFQCAPIAHVMQAAGLDVKRKAEDEQANVLHWMIKLVLRHGANWRKEGSKDINAWLEAARAKAAP